MALPGQRRTLADGTRKASQSQTDPITIAITDLYQACHLRPPAILVARDAVHFGQLVGRLARSSSFIEVMSYLLLGVILSTMLLPPIGNAIAAVYGAFVAVLVVPWMLASMRTQRSIRAALGETVLRMLATLLLGAAVAGTAYLVGLGYQMALLTAGIAMGAGACVQLVFVPLMPCFVRWGLSRTLHAGSRPLPWSVILRGAARLDTILTARLASALQDVEQARGSHAAGDFRGHRGQTQWAMQAAIREAAQSLGVWSSNVGLVLGQSVGYSTDPAAQVGALASAGVDPAGLPRILQPAMELDRCAEAVAVFRGVAVVLPAGAPATFTPQPVASGPHRRSGRLPWREALRWLSEAPGLALAVDLAPSDRMAEWLIARRLARLPEAERRTPAIRALGVDRLVAALRLRPVQEDEHGRLYQIGRHEDPSVFVAVRDHVLDGSGAPLEHWIAVPPYVATAREAVAWSFGMGEAEYQPSKEA
jgi:hypothetical protein